MRRDWISSLEISEITGKSHKKIRKKIKRTIARLDDQQVDWSCVQKPVLYGKEYSLGLAFTHELVKGYAKLEQYRILGWFRKDV